jgi:hypothetical protein
MVRLVALKILATSSSEIVVPGRRRCSRMARAMRPAPVSLGPSKAWHASSMLQRNPLSVSLRNLRHRGNFGPAAQNCRMNLVQVVDLLHGALGAIASTAGKSWSSPSWGMFLLPEAGSSQAA